MRVYEKGIFTITEVLERVKTEIEAARKMFCEDAEKLDAEANELRVEALAFLRNLRDSKITPSKKEIRQKRTNFRKAEILEYRADRLRSKALRLVTKIRKGCPHLDSFKKESKYPGYLGFKCKTCGMPALIHLRGRKLVL